MSANDWWELAPCNVVDASHGVYRGFVVHSWWGLGMVCIVPVEGEVTSVPDVLVELGWRGGSHALCSLYGTLADSHKDNIFCCWACCTTLEPWVAAERAIDALWEASRQQVKVSHV